MGSYTTLKLGNFEIGWDKNDYDPYLLSLFQPGDKFVKETTIGESGFSEDYEESEKDDPITIVEYRCPAWIVKDRLEVLGYTIQVAERGFEMGKAAELERILEWDRRAEHEFVQHQKQILESLTLEEWKTSVLLFHQEGLARYSPEAEALDLSALQKYCLESSFYGFPGYQRLHFLRLLVEIVPGNVLFIYDLTDLALGGWIDSSDDLIMMLDANVSAEYSAERRVIVCTEGNTDKMILERCLNLFYPHLSDFYRFMDFENSRVPGGAGALATNIKAFAAAGILNRCVALFDNDTAARSAMRPLENIELPNHFVIQNYPALEFLTDYPTLGPTGLVSMDVNGLAGSIELYLGQDVLTDSNGDFSPIQWTGYDKSMQSYQGLVLDKELILDRFWKRLQKTESQEIPREQSDWKGIHAILQSLFKAFQSTDEEAILGDSSIY